ncbi:MAG TPA: glycerol-3-phosphate acyltransferase, partial [Thermoanaerobaculia bacterium]|nr:glycerol-3-phosphate acyltransferase [Thermoanaerobaculia bacterium]
RAACAVAAVAGHVYPLFFGFRGGKGVATGFGALAALAPRAGAASAVVFAGTAAASGYVSAGSMAGALSFPLLVAAGSRWRLDVSRRSVLAAASAIGALILARHGDNLRRLRAGSERRWRDRRPEGATP